MYGAPVIKLAEDPGRLAIKAAIKRGSRVAQGKLNQLDIDSFSELTAIYEQAREDIRVTILNHTGDSGSLRLETMNSLLGQVNQRLDQLSVARNASIDNGLLAAARLGTDPVSAAGIGIDFARINEGAVRFVNDLVAEDGLQLTDRLWRIDNNAKQVVGQAIQSSIIQGHSASEAAQQLLSRGESVPADILSKMNIANASRVSQVASSSLMTGEGNPYRNALRVMRTEIGRANNKAFEESVFEVPEAIGTRFMLSPNHPRPDICDMHAGVNRYGLGAGVYPKGKNPYPAHPETISFMEVVFSDEVSKFDKESKEDRITWLNKQSGTTQEQVLGGRKKRAALKDGILKENQIATPWKVLKVRYQRLGLDVDSLQIKPVPLSTSNVVEGLNAVSVPVSKAIQAKGYKQVSKRTLAAIDSVHGDGSLDDIPIVRSSSRKFYGSYQYFHSGKPSKISVSSVGSHKELTLAHEIGHFIDHRGVRKVTGSSRKEIYASWSDATHDEWRDAVFNSGAIKHLKETRSAGMVNGYSVDKKYIDYLLTNHEAWARSYAQYIATRSGDEVMVGQLKTLLNRKKTAAVYYDSQWDEDDFQPIAQAFDRLFTKLGWISDER
jgi:hypothetical protein